MDTDITVGVPTYKRPYLLERALNLLVKYPNKLIIKVSVDGINEDYNHYKKIEKKFIKFKNIEFIYHKKNIGSLKNFLFLKNIATTEFFIWLADDDEINYLTIKNLYKILVNDKSAVTAVPWWKLINKNNKSKLIIPSHFDDNSLLKRVLKYIYSSDDAFFYGLHRTKNLKNCSFEGYWWPNKEALSNWCYVFQLDLVLQGKIIFLNNKKNKWINHDYGLKFYTKSSQTFLLKYIIYFFRKINIYYLYLNKLFKNRKFIIFFIILIFCPFFLFRDLIMREPILRKINFE